VGVATAPNHDMRVRIRIPQKMGYQPTKMKEPQNSKQQGIKTIWKIPESVEWLKGI